jgi:hypothetical protein
LSAAGFRSEDTFCFVTPSDDISVGCACHKRSVSFQHPSDKSPTLLTMTLYGVSSSLFRFATESSTPKTQLCQATSFNIPSYSQSTCTTFRFPPRIELAESRNFCVLLAERFLVIKMCVHDEFARKLRRWCQRDRSTKFGGRT